MPEISLTAQEMRQGLHMLLWHFQTERLTVTFKKILEHQPFLFSSAWPLPLSGVLWVLKGRSTETPFFLFILRYKTDQL